MIAYVESNFVLELTLEQPESSSCEAILRLAESGAVKFAIPAFALAEPHATLHRRHTERRAMNDQLKKELAQLARSASHSGQAIALKPVSDLLMEASGLELSLLKSVTDRILRVAEVIPLTDAIVARSLDLLRAMTLSGPDALILASVVTDLETRDPAEESCFVNRNSKDFDSPLINDLLATRRCRLLPRFEAGLQYLRRPAAP
ncbi:MAG: DUF4935 domain-containing protein [Chloroflexi bacterium]|nr:DUF4935 domain-containing protein [Chloroflexota bacterium]